MKKTILIAGGTGFIGYHLAKRALKKKIFGKYNFPKKTT